MTQLKRSLSRKSRRKLGRYEVRDIDQFGMAWTNKYRTLFMATIMYYYHAKIVGSEVYLNDLQEP